MYLGSEGALDVEGKELPRLVYVSREKRPGYQHHKKAGAMNALVSVSSPASNDVILTDLSEILEMDMDLKVLIALSFTGSCLCSPHKCAIHLESGL